MRYKEIIGYKYKYRISEAGVVETYRKGAWVQLKPTIIGYRRATVRLRKLDGKCENAAVTHLMAHAFMGGIPPGHCVMVKNGAKFDTALENLEIRPLKATGGDKSSKTVLKINRWGRVVDIYRNAAEAAKKNNMSLSAIRERCLNAVADPYGLDDHDYQYEQNWTGTGKRRKVEG